MNVNVRATRGSTKCKHRWAPYASEAAEGWLIRPQCRTCGIFGSPEEAKLPDLLLQTVSIRVKVR